MYSLCGLTLNDNFGVMFSQLHSLQLILGSCRLRLKIFICSRTKFVAIALKMRVFFEQTVVGRLLRLLI